MNLKAEAEPGYRFVNWSGAVSTTSVSVGISMKAGDAKTVTANFKKQYALTVEADPASCGTTGGSKPYDEGKEAAVSVSWNAGCRFTGWSSGVTDVSTDTGKRTSSGKFTVNSTTTVTASFVKQYYLWILHGPSGCGRVSGAGWHDPDKAVPISATANAGCRFVRWWGSGVANTAARATTITMPPRGTRSRSPRSRGSSTRSASR